MNGKDKIRYEKIMKALKKYGINSEAELFEAAKKQKPIEITCMVSKVPTEESDVLIKSISWR